jgi:hypothetical protein
MIHAKVFYMISRKNESFRTRFSTTLLKVKNSGWEYSDKENPRTKPGIIIRKIHRLLGAEGG